MFRCQPVGRLTMTNSAGLVGDAPGGGLATVNGASLTRGLSGATRVITAGAAWLKDSSLVEVKP